MSAAAAAQTQTTVEFFGLVPGEQVEASVAFHYGMHGAEGINFGMSAETVDDYGTVAFSFNPHTLTRGHQGAFSAWARPAGADFNADPLVGSYGKCVIHGVHLP